MWTPLRLRGRAPYLAKRLLLGAIIAGGFPQPALSLDFTKGTLDPRITASGGAGGTRMSASGNIVSASCPRFDHENPRTNLVTQSDGNASTYSSTAGTTNAAAPISLPPVGFTNSIQFPAAGICTAYKISTQVVGGTYTFTFFVQMDDGSVPVISSSDTPSVDFSVQANNTPLAADSITAVGVGVYRVSKTFVAISHNTVGVVRYAAQSGKRFKVTGFQLEVGNVATPYIPTGDTAVTVASPKGVLVEEQRTNLITQSAQFNVAGSWVLSGGADLCSVTIDSATAPDGTASADKIQSEVGAGTNPSVYSSGTVATAQRYVGSVYLKAGTIDSVKFEMYQNGIGTVAQTARILSGPGSVSAPGTSIRVSGLSATEWTRVEVVSDAAVVAGALNIYLKPQKAAAVAAGDNFYAWGAQLEAGSFPTSYIPTAAAAVTRTADSLVMTGAKFSSWYRQAEGTIVISAERHTEAQKNSGLYYINDGTVDNRLVSVSNSLGTTEQYLITTAAVQQLAVGGIPQKIVKSAMAYASNNGAVLQKGIAISIDATLVPPAVDRLTLAEFSGNRLNGHLKKFIYYRTRVSNATMFRLVQAL